MPAAKTTLVYEPPIRVVPQRDQLNPGSPTRTKPDPIAARTESTLQRQRLHPSLRHPTPRLHYSIVHLTKGQQEVEVGSFEDTTTTRPPTFSKAFKECKVFKQYLNRLFRENPHRIETIFFKKGTQRFPGFRITGSYVITETGKRLIVYRPVV